MWLRTTVYSIQPEKDIRLQRQAEPNLSYLPCQNKWGKCPQVLPVTTPLKSLQQLLDGYSGLLAFSYFLKLGQLKLEICSGGLCCWGRSSFSCEKCLIVDRSYCSIKKRGLSIHNFCLIQSHHLFYSETLSFLQKPP